MQTFSKNDDHRSFVALEEILKDEKSGEDNNKQPEKFKEPRDNPRDINTPLVLGILERLSPGFTQLLLETIRSDEDLTRQLREGQSDLVDLYRMMENTARPQIAPTARSANAMGSGGFNAHALSEDEFARIRQMVQNGNNVRI